MIGTETIIMLLSLPPWTFESTSVTKVARLPALCGAPPVLPCPQPRSLCSTAHLSSSHRKLSVPGQNQEGQAAQPVPFARPPVPASEEGGQVCSYLGRTSHSGSPPNVLSEPQGWQEAFTTTRFSPLVSRTHRSKGSKTRTQTRPRVPGDGVCPPPPPALICL